MRAKRFISVILSILIVCSSFAGLTVFADENNNHTYTVVGDAAFLSAKWTPNTPADDLTLQVDGTYKITYTNVAKSDLYTVKVAEDHAWGNSFGSALGNNYDIQFSVPEDNSIVDIILTLQGTKDLTDYEGNVIKTVNDGYVTVLVNGALAPSKIIPEITEYYIAGDSGLCNGVLWNQAAPENKMTENEDGSYEITFTDVQPKSDGTPYEFKVTTNGAWDPAYGYEGIIAPGGANVQLMITEKDSTVKIVLTKDLYVEAYVNGKKYCPFGITGDCTWYYDLASNILTISGEGNMGSYKNIGGGPWQGYDIKTVIINHGVKSIGNYAFCNCADVESITIPDSITRIGKNAFKNCDNLTRVNINDLKSWCNIGFLDNPLCSAGNLYINGEIITDLLIPNDVESVGGYAFTDDVTGEYYNYLSPFLNCTCIKTLTIPDSVKSIGSNAFNGCSSLSNVTISNSITSIDIGAFYNCSNLSDVYYDGTKKEWNSITIRESNNNLLNATTHYARKESQWINNVESKYEVIYGSKPFNLGAKSETNLTYVSDNTDVAVVSDYGTVTIKGTGKATITITAEETEEYNSATFTTSIEVNKINQKITGIESKVEIPYSPIAFNLNANAKTKLSYSSDNISVVEVSSDGTVTIIGAGSATITVTAEETDEYASAIAKVLFTVNKASQKVSVAEKEYELTYGAKPFNLGAKADTTLTYVSNNLNVAEVSSDGTVTINGAGTANIIIMGEETDNYTSAITTVKIIVKKTSQEITGFEPKYEVTFGDKPFSLNAKAETALLYASDNTSVAEVSSNGTVTIKNSGIASIMIIAKETANYNSTTATVKIIVNKTSPEITGFETNYNVKFGDNPFSLNAKAETALLYASDNTSVAEVSADGTVTIKGAGKATITITAEETANYKSATATVEITVGKASQKVTGFEPKYEVTFGDNPFSLNAKAETALSYASDNTSVAEVSTDGTVTIKGAGTATITITAEEAGNYNSATATVKITVSKATQRVTGVKTQYVTKAGKSFILKPKAKTKLTYTSSNKNVAVVSSTGKVTVKAGGYAYITVKASENGNYKSAYAKTKIISAPRDFTSKDISKVKKTGKTTAKITWKSLAGATGYTVQLATNKTFKSAKTVKNSKNTANFTNLKKGKTYYVRINAYTKVSGKNYSNKWYTVKFKM